MVSASSECPIYMYELFDSQGNNYTNSSSSRVILNVTTDEDTGLATPNLIINTTESFSETIII